MSNVKIAFIFVSFKNETVENITGNIRKSSNKLAISLVDAGTLHLWMLSHWTIHRPKI